MSNSALSLFQSPNFKGNSIVNLLLVSLMQTGFFLIKNLVFLLNEI